MADGNIDNLNFGVILTDTNFDKQIESVKNKAKQFNTDVSKLLDFQVKISSTEIIKAEGVQNAQTMAGSIRQIVTDLNSLNGKNILFGDADALNETLKKVLENLDKMNEKGEKGKETFKGINSSLSQSHNLMSDLARLTGIAFGAAGVRQFLTGLVRISGEFEVQKMALTSMLQDADKADAIFNTLRQRALESPYTFQDLTKYAKQLTAFNIDADKLVETEKRLADVAAGLGVDMGRIILAYGQVKAAGVLKGTELRQFTEAGVPLLQSLADQIMETEKKAVSLSEVFSRISKKQIPFEMVEEAFRRMTDEGGKFYNMQEVLVSTLQGKIGKLRDTWQQFLYDMGQSNSGVLKGAVDSLTDFIGKLSSMGDLFGALIKGIGAYAAALAIAATAQRLVFGVQAIAQIGSTITAIRKATTMMEGFAIASTAAKTACFALAAVVTIFTLISNQIKEAHAAQDRLNAAINKCEEEVDAEIHKLDELKGRLESAKKGSKEFKEAKDEIVQNYGKYFDGLDNEITKVGNLETSYKDLSEAIMESIRVRNYSEFEASEKKIMDEGIDTSVGKIKDRLLKRKDLIRADVATIMAEINRMIDSQSSFEDFQQTSVYERYFGIGSYIGDIRQIFSTAAKYRDDYLKNTRQAVETFGLKGTVYDPDFMGPLPQKKNNNNNNKPQNSWIPEDSNATKKAVQNIQTTVDAIKELQRAYKDFKEMGLDDETILGLFAQDSMFGYIDKELRDRLDYWQMLTEQAEKLDKLDPNAAARLRGDIARGQADEAKKEWKEARKALEEYEKAFAKFDKDWGDGEVGTAGKFEKAIRDHNNEDKKIDEQYVDAQMKAYEAHKDNVDIISEETDKLYKLYQARKKANDSKLKDALQGLADDLFKDQMKGYDMTDWSDKTLSDLLAIKDALDNLSIPDEIAQQLSPEELAMVDAELGRIRDKFLENTVIPAIVKNGVKPAKKIAEYIGKAGDEMIRLGEAVGNSGLTDAGKALNAISQNLSAAQKGYETAQSMGAGAYSWIGAVVGGLVDIFKQVSDAVGDANEQMIQMADTIRDIRGEVERGNFDELLTSGTDGLFGENFVRRIKNAIDGLNGLGEKLKEIDKLWNEYHSWYFMNGPMQQSWYLNQGVGATKIRTKESFWGDTWKTLQDLSDELNIGLLDVNDNLNPELLNKILELYGDLNNEAKDWLKSAIEYSEMYEKAMEQIEESTKDIFESVASDMADTFIDNFLRIGNAVDDLGDVFTALGETILRSFLQSYILDEILSKYEKEAKDALTSYAKNEMSPEEYAQWLSDFAADVKRDSETLAPAINSMIDAFKDRGLLGSDAETADSLGAGIKGISEEIASLLASYINAMRADLSYMRVMQETGWKNVASIAEHVAAPTLNDYLAQVAANTFDTAQNTQSILSELQAVIGAPGTTGMVVRVERTN